jgi:hypothetical protein
MEKENWLDPDVEELNQHSVIKDYLITAADGKKYQTGLWQFDC